MLPCPIRPHTDVSVAKNAAPSTNGRFDEPRRSFATESEWQVWAVRVDPATIENRGGKCEFAASAR
jgi:hypothetical protein